MKFFVPVARDDAEAQFVYGAFAKFIGAPIKEKRIWKIKWQHNSKDFECEVGKVISGGNGYFANEGLALAIFDCENHYKICTQDRGGVRGDPILAEKDMYSHVTYFDA